LKQISHALEFPKSILLLVYERKNERKSTQSDQQLKRELCLLTNQLKEICLFNLICIFKVSDYITLNKNCWFKHFHLEFQHRSLEVL
jgi:MinD superfamily P-loop ATPase